MAVAPASPRPRQADRRQLLREYVAGSADVWYGQLRRGLPAYVDDVTRDFGDDLYDRMLVDPQVAACVAILKAAILEEGVALAPAIDDEADERYALAREIDEAAERMLDDLATPLDDVLWDMLTAVAFGNRVAEQTYDVRPGVGGRQRLDLVALKVKPRRSTAFVVDTYLNVLGLLADVEGRGRAIAGGAALEPADVLPREKFAVLTFRPKDADPRGTSILRPAYDPWWRKRQTIPEYLKYLAQFAGPSLAGFTAKDAPDVPAVDELGVETGETWTPEEAMLWGLKQFQNGTVGAFPHDAKIQPIEMSGDGRAFLNAIAECNLEITKAILTQQLATEEGEHQARAAAQVHQDVLDTLVRQGKRSVTRMLRRDILRPWVRWNWGDEAAAALTPVPTLGTTERRDLPTLMNAVAALKRAGYLHDSQLPETDKLLALPVRDLTVEPAPGDEDSDAPADAEADRRDIEDRDGEREEDADAAA